MTDTSVHDSAISVEDFRQRAVYYGQVHDVGYAALQDLRRSKSADPVAFLSESFKATNILPRSTQRATYQEILSAGALGLVGDDSVRRRIMTYYAGLDMTDRLTAMQKALTSRLQAADAALAGLQSQQQVLTSSVQAVDLAMYGKNWGTAGSAGS